MTQPQDSTQALAALAASPATATVPALWAALPADERRRALALAIKGDKALRPVLVALLRESPRYRGFRPQSFNSWTADQFADAFKSQKNLSPDVMQSGLIALHVTDRGEMLGAFLDSLGVPHEQGVIDELPQGFAPDEATLGRAADELAARFPREQVTVYFLTLLVLEPQVWSGLAAWLGRQASVA